MGASLVHSYPVRNSVMVRTGTGTLNGRRSQRTIASAKTVQTLYGCDSNGSKLRFLILWVRPGICLMRCPACNKEYKKQGWCDKHKATCRGTFPSFLVAGGDDPSRPPPLRLVPSESEWLWVSTFSLSDGVGRRLPRLYRMIPFAGGGAEGLVSST